MNISDMLIRTHWCSNENCSFASAREYVQGEGYRDGHYHVLPLGLALDWYASLRRHWSGRDAT